MSRYAIVCACGLRKESDEFPFSIDALYEAGHDPTTCSAQIAYQGKIDGRMEMVDVIVEHLMERRTLGGGEIAEIRTNLIDRARRLG